MARLVWVADPYARPMRLSCGHTTQANGAPPLPLGHRPTVHDVWTCERCDPDVPIARIEEQLVPTAATPLPHSGTGILSGPLGG
jgi:hypothetical protein